MFWVRRTGIILSVRINLMTARTIWVDRAHTILSKYTCWNVAMLTMSYVPVNMAGETHRVCLDFHARCGYHMKGKKSVWQQNLRILEMYYNREEICNDGARNHCHGCQLAFRSVSFRFGVALVLPNTGVGKLHYIAQGDILEVTLQAKPRRSTQVREITLGEPAELRERQEIKLCDP